MFFKILRFWFTGKDNESYEILRALTALCVVMMLFYIGWHLIVNKLFDPLAAGGGLGGLLLGGGLGTATKDGTMSKSFTKTGTTVENIENVEVQPDTIAVEGSDILSLKSKPKRKAK